MIYLTILTFECGVSNENRDSIILLKLLLKFRHLLLRMHTILTTVQIYKSEVT